MSNYIDIINSLKQTAAAKKNEVVAIDNMLLLADANLDKYKVLIRNIDKAALPLINEINVAAEELKQAYDDRITSGCRNNLSWQEIESWIDEYIESNDEYRQFQVLVNPDTQQDTNLVGIKYYQTPSDRDYGSNIILEFDGSISYGSTNIIVDQISSLIQIDDTIVDNIDSPQIFNASNLPTVVGFGTTAIVGIVSSIIGGISTGSTIFAHYGSGISTTFPIGSTLERTGIVTASIVGFGITDFPIVYYNSAGIFTTGIITSTALILDSSAIDYAADVSFNILQTQTKSTIGLSTNANAFGTNVPFTVIRTDQTRQKTDFTKSPNAPLNIGIINSGNVGLGNSAYFNESGDPNERKTWNPNESFYDPVEEEIINPEPKVGAGKVTYNIGDFAWPALITCTEDEFGLTDCTAVYASENTTVTIGGTNTSISLGTTSISPLSPSPSLCSQLDDAITEKLNNYNEIRNRNLQKIKNLVNTTKTLRKQKGDKQIYAWSLLQAKSSLNNDIIDLEEDLSELESTDFSEFDN